MGGAPRARQSGKENPRDDDRRHAPADSQRQAGKHPVRCGASTCVVACSPPVAGTGPGRSRAPLLMSYWVSSRVVGGGWRSGRHRAGRIAAKNAAHRARHFSICRGDRMRAGFPGHWGRASLFASSARAKVTHACFVRPVRRDRGNAKSRMGAVPWGRQRCAFVGWGESGAPMAHCAHYVRAGDASSLRLLRGGSAGTHMRVWRV